LTKHGKIKEEQKTNLLLLNYIFQAPVPEQAATNNTVIKLAYKNTTCNKGCRYTFLQAMESLC